MTAISISNLSFAYDGADNIFENVSLTLNSSWKLGLIGRNGRGKTTFLKLLQGKLDFTGSINCPLNVEYFPFAVQGEHENALELALSFSGGAQEWQLERELAFLDVTPAVLGRPFVTLSGGEATKL
ncbi:ATP-binding cassette domain-containing protein, partial [Desulfovibrio sp. OttesenSCG-928-F07]|nr:ATP-binding cassette domain-containing protein [Desulfovibrio sp. OttesenSCG-928-F07]